MKKVYVIKSRILDTELDVADPNYPNLYWSNDWGWGTFDGATVYDENGKKYNSNLNGEPLMLFEDCSWQEVDPQIVTIAEYVDSNGTRFSHQCVDIYKNKQAGE